MCVILSHLYCSKISVSHKCEEKDMEICAVELETISSKLIMLSIYGESTGDFNQFINYPDDAVKHLYKPKWNY